MRYHTLGRTGLEVSVLGFGASPLGDVFSVTDPEEGLRTVRRAIDVGINFFDVSPYYGHTLAEQRLGRALVGARHKVILATKCGRYGVDDFDFSAGGVTAGLEESLRRLKTDYVDLLQVHDAEFGAVDQIVHETLPALKRLQEQGKARFIGITGYALRVLAAIAQAAPVDTVLSYCRYNLLIRDMDEILTPVLRERSVGLLNASPLHMGVLSPNPLPAWHPAPPHVQAAGRRAAAIAEAHGTLLPEIALRFCLAHPDVASTLVGISTRRELEQNLRALEPAAIDDAAVIAAIEADAGAAINVTWPSGLAEHHE